MTKKHHAVSSLLPITVTLIFPLLLLFLTGSFDPWYSFPPFQNLLLLLVGILPIILGIYLLFSTISKFAIEGEGTLSPHAPTQKLVVTGIYQHVRNPMITGVILILLGESLILPSLFVIIWSLVFFIGNHIYFIKSEEPGLIARFGEEYLMYKENVPRWLPRRTPWSPNETSYERENE